MGMFEQFPYSNFHELNLDWIINKLNELGQNAVLSVNGQTGDVVVICGIDGYSFTRGHRYRLRAKDHAVEVVITLLQVGEHELHALTTFAEQFVLRLKGLLLGYELPFLGRGEEREEYIEEHDTEAYTSQYIPPCPAEPVLESVLHALHSERLGIDIKVRFSHATLVQPILAAI